MSGHGKRPRTSGASSSGSQDSNSRPPWPRAEGSPIPSQRRWTRTPRRESVSAECTQRDILEQWDEYDTLFYNAWLEVKIKPTRMMQSLALRRMKLDHEVKTALTRIGLGTICTKRYDLYPDLVRQFMATVRVYYKDERNPRAPEGTLTFMIRGMRYRVSLRTLCDIYGFDSTKMGTIMETDVFSEFQTYWGKFAEGFYSPQSTVHSDIRHPVLRYVVRAISNTILCKMEPGKLRQSELYLLCYVVQDLLDFDWAQLDIDLNLGAVFAHHLVELKTKPFTGKGAKSESVGSLLTPIFQHCAISLEGCAVVTDESSMDETFLRNARWIKPSWIWCYRSGGVDYTVQLPQEDLTRITGDVSTLLFQPHETVRRRPAPPRRRRGASSQSVPTAAEDDPVPDSAQHHTPRFPSPPHIPMETADFQRYMVQTMRGMWDMIASTITCSSSRQRSRSRTPPLDAASDDDSF